MQQSTKILLSVHDSRRNILLCAIVIFVLNYNIAITSFMSFSIKYTDYSLWLDISIFFGLIIGENVFGILGDSIGRKKAFKASAMIMVIGLVALVGNITEISVGSKSFQVGILRCIIGIGIGGMMPLASTISRESSPKVISKTSMYLFVLFHN